MSTQPSPPSRSDRQWDPASPDARNPFQIDRDRILYTPEFLRLAEVTQVVGPEEAEVFHNRLTHSLKVAQVARRLAEKLVQDQPRQAAAAGGIDPDVTEAAALAHDIGHPPFGHLAEEELDRLLTAANFADGFEGNAQSFRVVTKLAARRLRYRGLNLTRATLNGLLKYPWLRGTEGKRKRKWGAYGSEAAEFHFARQMVPSGDDHRSVEAELMDWADDVTYAVHDVADFYSAALIPMERLTSVHDSGERQAFYAAVFERLKRQDPDALQRFTQKGLEEAFEKIVAVLPSEGYRGTQSHRAVLQSATSKLIHQYVNAIRLRGRTTSSESSIEIDPDRQKEVIMLKQITWHYVILNPFLTTQQHGLRRLIRKLFEILHDAATQGDHLIFPFNVRERFA